VGEAQPVGDAARRVLDELHDKGLNFDLERRDQFTPANGWNVDDYRQPLPPEPAGRPLPDGSWQAARRLIRDYAFADPSIIRAVYYPDRPLEQREMLLEGRFLGLRFYFGCRVGGVNDEIRVVDARQVQVWGWNYRTLQGHLEMGQMDYEVWKWLDSGGVEFRIHVVSKPAHIPDPVVRLGFRVFGRAMQRRFARHACQRMAQLTTAALHRGPGDEYYAERPASPRSGQLTVAPAAGYARTQRRLARNATVPTTREAKPHRSQMPITTPFPRALLLGAVTGMRSQLPIALLGLQSFRGRFDPGRSWLARWLATPSGVATAVLASVGELIVDKLPVVPDRTRPGPFTGRVAVGTVVGAAAYQDAHRPAPYGAVVGAAAAAASTLALARARTALARRTPLPDRAWGVVEDALALTLGLLAVRSRPAAPHNQTTPPPASPVLSFLLG
jgi:uncharacterized membrane protein/uncharacterized protein (UPF0548 family)